MQNGDGGGDAKFGAAPGPRIELESRGDATLDDGALQRVKAKAPLAGVSKDDQVKNLRTVEKSSTQLKPMTSETAQLTVTGNFHIVQVDNLVESSKPSTPPPSQVFQPVDSYVTVESEFLGVPTITTAKLHKEEECTGFKEYLHGPDEMGNGRYHSLLARVSLMLTGEEVVEGKLHLYWRARARRLMDLKVVKAFVGFVILANAVYIGVDTDNPMPPQVSVVMECMFTFIFFVELCIRLFAEELTFFVDGWNVLDFVLVGLSCVDTLILQNLPGGGEGMGAFTAIRTLRLLRVARIVRLFKQLKELWLFVAGITSALRTLFWASPIITLVIYIFGIITTRMIGHKHKASDPNMDVYFGTVSRSMFTLFQCMTTEGWADVARESMVYEPWAGIFFIFFLCVTAFAITNVVVAVVVENSVSTALKDTEDIQRRIEQERLEATKNIMRVFSAGDKDGNRELTIDEFYTALGQPQVRKLLATLGIDVRQAAGLFDILDYDGSGALEIEEFVEGVMKARGEAKAQDVLAVHCDIWRCEQRICDQLRESVHKLRESQRTLEKKLKLVRHRWHHKERKEGKGGALSKAPVAPQGTAVSMSSK